MSKTNFGIHWFRRDLRIAGNAALKWNWKKHEGRVLGLFCFDSQFLAREDFSHNRFAFFLNALNALKEDLKKSGGDLLVLDELPQKALPRLIHYCRERGDFNPTAVSFCRDYEPFARKRDKDIQNLLQDDLNLEVHTERDHLIIEPFELWKDEGQRTFYQIYTPFSKKWFLQFKEPEFQKRISGQKNSLQYFKKEPEKIFNLKWDSVLSPSTDFKDSLFSFTDSNSKKVSIEIPESGSREAFSRLQKFKNHLDLYGEKRDFPFTDGTSKLALYFKNGSLTTSQVIAYLNLDRCDQKGADGPTKFLKEIIWREFYYSILWHCPRVEKEAFLQKYINIQWQNNADFFRSWCEGRTGFPIVDAGMRQLNQTGWMHNRVRMIVASFLTKDLLIDWKWGENYFMKYLLDGDLAPNNGGWQWAASTGCDPQPYFRIFNPWLQSKKFDPDGIYIKEYVPELRQLQGDALHEPHLHGGAKGYPSPIVDHAIQKEKAIALYKNIKG